MAVQTDDEPGDSRRSALGFAILGILLGSVSSIAAYEFSYKGLGPGPDDPMGRSIVTLGIVFGMIFALVLVFMGLITYWSERGSAQ